MKTTRKTSDSRERDLRLALARIQRGRPHTGETKVTIAAVAREAGVSTALIHNHYPNVAEAIREAQGRSSRAQRDVKHQDLIADLASINEVLMAELRALKARSGDLKIVALPSHKT
jgi:AcrR family transcriptional regulator